MRRPHSYSRPTLDAARVFGLELTRARRRRRWKAEELAERVGVSRDTLRKVEKGDPTVTLGIAFEIATILGVPLFGADRDRLAALVERGRERLALLPARVRESPEEDNDAF
jgi:transcriptional regulator with XRE-family HTH domain